MAFGKTQKGRFTTEEPLDIAGVIDAPPQRCFLSKIVDSDLVGCKITFCPRNRVEDARRGLSSSRCIGSTRKKAAAILEDHNAVARWVVDEFVRLVIGVCSKCICR